MIAYKLFRTLKTKPGLYPLFIGKTKETVLNEWIPAENIPTKGYAARHGWHCGVLPIAPHLRTKQDKRAENRVWCRVEVKDYYEFKTSKMQGKAWIIGQGLKVLEVMDNQDIIETLVNAGIDYNEAIKEAL